MKLKAPPGAGDPCVGGVTIAPRNGVYDVDAEIGALLIECFGFVDIDVSATDKAKAAARRGKAAARKVSAGAPSPRRAGREGRVEGALPPPNLIRG